MPYIKPNHTSAVPNHFVVLDTETYTDPESPVGVERQRLHLGVMRHWHYNRRSARLRIVGDREYVFRSTGELTVQLEEIFSEPKQCYWIYAHNSNFDYGIVDLPQIVKTLGLEVTSYVNEKPPVIIKTKGRGCSQNWLDTLNVFQSSLAQIARSLGIPDKLPLPHWTDDDALLEYCRHDVQILHTALDSWRRFILEESMGAFTYTLAGQAWNAWRHRHLGEARVARTLKPDLVKIERAAYLGGRVECFRIGRVQGPVHLVDVNSIYPFVMRENAMPVLFHSTGDDMNPFELKFPDGLMPALVQLTATVQRPCLPVRHNHRLVFPVGRLSGVWHVPEVEAALPYLSDIEYHRIVVYRSGRIFTSFVDEMYGRRLEAKRAGDKSRETLYKLMLNSLYGKFGQLSHEWIDSGVWMPEGVDTALWENPRTGEVHKVRRRFGKTQIRVPRGEHRNAVPVIAGFVTALARAYMLRLIGIAGWQNVHYMDTDSLMVNDSGLERLQDLIHPDQLGALGHEWTSKSVTLHGLKRYDFDGGRKSKGVRATAERLAPDTYRQSMFRSADYHWSRGESGFIDVLQITKRLSSEYMKGTVEVDGSVSPLVLG